MKKRTRTSYKNVADKLWSQVVRSVGKCAVCGITEYLNPHHIIGRRNMATRFDLKNGICLCSGCHTFRKLSAHQDPLWFADWLKKYKPEIVKYLDTKRNEIKQWTIPMYEELINQLKEKL